MTFIMRAPRRNGADVTSWSQGMCLAHPPHKGAICLLPHACACGEPAEQ
jgi:hypothetical protein